MRLASPPSSDPNTLSDVVVPVTGVDLQNDGNTTNDRPILNGYMTARDAFRQPAKVKGKGRQIHRQGRLGRSPLLTVDQRFL